VLLAFNIWDIFYSMNKGDAANGFFYAEEKKDYLFVRFYAFSKKECSVFIINNKNVLLIKFVKVLLK
jgi:hypothetical protein